MCMRPDRLVLRTNGIGDWFPPSPGYNHRPAPFVTYLDYSVYGLPGNPHLQRRRRQAVSPQARVDPPEPAGEWLPVRRRLAREGSRFRDPHPSSPLGRGRGGLAVIVFAARHSSPSRWDLLCSLRSRRRPTEFVAAVVVIAVAIGWAHLFLKIGTFTKVDDLSATKERPGRKVSRRRAPCCRLHEHWRWR